MELEFIQADDADFNHGSSGLIVNMSKKQWLKFHKKHEAGYLCSQLPEDNVSNNFHHYYSVDGSIIHIAVRGIDRASLLKEKP